MVLLLHGQYSTVVYFTLNYFKFFLIFCCFTQFHFSLFVHFLFSSFAIPMFSGTLVHDNLNKKVLLIFT